MSKPKSVALLQSGETLPAFWVSCLDELVESTDLEVTHIIRRTTDPVGAVDDPKPTLDALETICSRLRFKKGERLVSIYKRKGPWALMAVRDYILRTCYRSNPLPPLKQQRDVDSISALADAKTIKCEPIQTHGKWVKLPDSVVDEVASETDLVVLVGGFGLLEGEILTASDHGVLSFHYGDVETHRGAPSGYWEYLDDEQEAAVTVQQLTDSIDGGRVVVKEPVDLTGVATWDDVRARLFQASVPLLADAVERITDPEFEAKSPEQLGELNTWSEAKQKSNMIRCISRDLQGLW